ncbi:MAG: hypothetical protein ACOZIN_08630 [Myxococcota bacterium]
MKTGWKSLALCLVAGAGFATTMVAVDVPGLTKGSDAVVHGKVTGIEAKWSGDRRRIFTEVSLEVVETWKGAPPARLVIVQPGGVVGDVGQRVEGVAHFRVGEEVVVFLEARGTGRYLVSGMAQGKYRVERSTDGQLALAVPDSAGPARILDPRTGREVPQRSTVVKLAELKAQVRDAQAEASPPSVAPVPPRAPRKTVP